MGEWVNSSGSSTSGGACKNGISIHCNSLTRVHIAVYHTLCLHEKQKPL